MAKKAKKIQIPDSVRKGIKENADAEVASTIQDVPPGISEGYAKLESIKIDDKGEGKGLFFLASGTCVGNYPNEKLLTYNAKGEYTAQPSNMKTEGRRTSQYVSLKEDENQQKNFSKVTVILKRLGIPEKDVKEKPIEDIISLLAKAKPYFRFSTSQSEPTKQYPNATVWHNWDTWVKKDEVDFGTVAEDDEVQSDLEEDQEEEQEDQEEDSTDESEPSISLEELEELATKAEGGDGKAEDKLTELGKEAGLSSKEIDEMEHWQDVVNVITNSSEENLEETEEVEDEEEMFTPEKGETYEFTNGDDNELLEGVVTKVLTRKKVVNLKVGKTLHQDIPWSSLN